MAIRGNKEDTRRSLVEAGADILHRQGYNGTGIQEVLEACGVPKGSFYHFFKSKEDFALAVVDHHAQQLGERMRALLSDASAPPVERLRGFFDAGLARVADPQNALARCGCPIGNLVQEMAAANPAFRERLDKVLGGLESLLAEVLRQGQSAGDISPHFDPEEAARFALASWQGAMLRMKAVGDVAPLVRARRFLLAMLEARQGG